MEPNVIAALLQDNYVTVQVKFKQEDTKTYTYKARKSLDLQEGDKVIVDSPHTGLTIVTVTDVHPFAKIDINATYSYTFIVQKIDTALYKYQVEKEQQFIMLVEQAQQAAARKQTEKMLEESFPSGTDAGDLIKQALELLK